MSRATFRASNTPQGLTENMQILTGQKGDRLDKALTLREAVQIGLLKLRRNNGGVVVPELPPIPPTDPEWSGVQLPHVPVNVTADGAFHTITLTWDIPTYKGHSHAEILRAEVDNPAVAVRVGTTLANVYSDTVGRAFSAYYWVRFVNKNGQVGPLHNVTGLRAETSPNVDEIIASATHFAIYNPAKPQEKEVIFGVTDKGKVAIREAVIKAATIQIIHSEKITADYIKAGVSISAPSISGGSFDMGNAFMSGGAAGFGLGGPYAGWGKGWHTIIYSDGSIHTNRLTAQGGRIDNMTMRNCTIEQNCVVKGTIYADRIMGDVAKVYALESYISDNRLSITIPSFTRTRFLVISGVEIYARGSTQSGAGEHADREITTSASCTISVAGSVTRDTVSATGSSGYSSSICGRTVMIPASQTTTVTISFTGGYRVRGAVMMVFMQ